MLHRLERTLQRQQNPSARTACAEEEEEEAVTVLLNDFDEVTRKLSTALEALEYVNGSIGLPLNDASYSHRSSTETPVSPSSMTTISEEGEFLSTQSSTRLVISKPASLSPRLRTTSGSAPSYNCTSEEKKQLTSSRTMTSPPSVSTDSTEAPSSLRSDRWSNQFAYFDPMSVDIDSASSLILGTRPSPHPPALMPRSPARIGSLSVICDSPRSDGRRSLTNPASNVDSYVARSASLRGASLLVRAAANSKRSASTSLRRSPGSQTLEEADRQIKAGATQCIPTASRDVLTKLQAPIQEQIRASTHRAADSILDDLTHLEPPSNPLAGPNTTRIRDRILSRSTRAPKSRYRIVNPEKDGLSRTDSARFVSSPESSSPSSSPIPPADLGRRAFTGFTPSLYKTESTPASRDTDEDCDENGTVDSELDKQVMNATISSWNSGQWDQARHNIELLASRRSEHRGGKLGRRLEHLLGVIASINGQPEVALAHFLAVFPVAIGDVCQLDVGHCAAACWMGDIYALLSRKTEAVLAYSVAARTPLAEDPTWMPLQQQILAERDACRSGDVKTGINLSLNPESRAEVKSADTILDPRIIARNVARTIMQAVSHPASRETRKLEPNRSRAMVVHDSGTMPGSWQEKHKLDLDVTAFEPSQSWPLHFDPFFVLENVRRHRLSTPESDLLRCGLSAARIPKKGRLSFSCQDLRWLIVTLRSCLTKLEIEWSEVVINYGPKFLARYKVAGDGITTSHFFWIPIYRLSFRPGYGVDVISDGISSSRIQGEEPKAEKGMHGEEAKRAKKMIKEALETAAKREEAAESKSMTLPVMSINGVTSLHRR